ncbi:hypothetical protein LVY65_13145 [Sphingomonas sp. G124]|uniref:Bacterial surface antigen (D15) domain-containing protein n=1 Tax=Sphingomonas cremea TaxID=2904799 RepID=A0A9X1QPV6_9SPHN|nr:hypothetical protein [Sphingomonas cremea]MCF2516002.1 hypothetical protein [Sphingomonas cremea]
MNGGRARRDRRWARRLTALCLSSVASGAWAQVQPEPPPPQPATTTIEEPPAPASDAETPVAPPTDEQKVEEPKHAPPNAGGIPLSTLETKNQSLLYFDPVQTYLTPYVARAFENAIEWHKRRFHWEPWDRTTVLLKDFGDFGNAAARSSPNNAVLLDVAPLSQRMETFTPGERFFTLINHELAHVATLDAYNKKDAFWRNFLGGKPMPIQEHPESILYNYLTTPRNNVPRWYAEGSAVFFETWMAGGLGRAQGGYDEMVFRAKVRDDDKLYSPLGLESEGIAIDFQIGANDYLYGTRFFSWLALTYGPEKVMQWLRREDGSAAFYATQFHRVFGKRLDDAWSDWHAWEREFQKANLARLSAYPLTDVQHLSPHGLGSMSRGYVDERTNRLVAAFRFPGQIGFIGTMDLDTGKLRKLADLKGMMLYFVTNIAFDPDSRKAYYINDNRAFRDLMEVDVDTGKKRMLLRDARIGDIVVNPRDKSIWGIRHQNGYATIVRIPPPYAGFNQIHTFDYGITPFDLDISPDGSLMSASYGEVNGTQSVRVWRTQELEDTGSPDEVARLDLPPSTPEGFTFAPDGKSLYGTSYFTGVSNVFHFDIPTQKYEVVSNASTGFFRPMLRPDGQLLVYEYTGKGFSPSLIRPEKRDDLGTIEFLGTKVVNTHPELKEWGVGSPAKVDLDPLITQRGMYRATDRMKLAASYPVVEGYKQKPAAGYYLHFEDPLQFHQLSATISVSPFVDLKDSERLHADIEYRSLNWKFRYWHNDADIYDLAGPVLRSRKGDAVIISYEKAKIYDPPRQLDLFGSVASYFGLEQLPSAQNVPSPKDIFSAELGVRYTNTRQSLGGVDHEKGIAWRLVGGADGADGEAFPHMWGGIDYGVPLPLSNSSAWIYAQAGIAGGKSESPLAAYYFGSFRNNYVDNRPEKRYRELESFPGFEIDEITARKFAKLTGEVNLPPLRFAEVGAPAFFLSYARPALFGGTMLLGSPEKRSYRLFDVGAQVDLGFTVIMRLPMVFSFGIARGFGDKDIDGRTEWLASLKIL